MTELFVVRHGQTEDNVQGVLTGQSGDSPLTKSGESQAAGLRKELSSHIFDLVISSPAQRAFNTACLAGFGQDLIVINNNLREKSFGIYEGKKVVEYENAIRNFDYPLLFSYNDHGGESFKELSMRIASFLSELSSIESRRILIFAHECVNRCIIAQCKNIPFSEWLNIPQRNASLERVKVSDGKAGLH